MFLLNNSLPHGRKKIVGEAPRMESYILDVLYRKTFIAKLTDEFILAVQMVKTRDVEVMLSPAYIDITKLA